MDMGTEEKEEDIIAQELGADGGEPLLHLDSGHSVDIHVGNSHHGVSC